MFDRLVNPALKRRMEQLEKAEHKTTDVGTASHRVVQLGHMCSDIGAWIAARLRGASFIVVRKIVSPPKHAPWSAPEHSTPTPVHPTASAEDAPTATHRREPPADPFDVRVASRFELLQRTLKYLRRGERAAIEAELARRNREQPVPYDENERAVLKRGMRDN